MTALMAAWTQEDKRFNGHCCRLPFVVARGTFLQARHRIVH